jgi:hypothetical protein
MGAYAARIAERRIGTLALNVRGAGLVLLPPIKEATADKAAANKVALHLQFDNENGDVRTTIAAELTVEGARDLAIRLWLAADQWC